MSGLPRRVVLIGAAVAPVAACSAANEKHNRAPSAPAAGQVLAPVAEIPVGSGRIVGDTIVTQPATGVFHGFVARCTHAGCVLTEVIDAQIVCPCHGSKFDLDGAVVRGPATQPLVPVEVSVKGTSVVAS